MSDSIWSGMTLAAYIYIVTDGSNSKVGFVEAAQGLATLITALPIGYIADHYGRSRAAVMGGIVSLIAIAATTFAVWLQSKVRLLRLCFDDNAAMPHHYIPPSYAGP